MSDQAPIINCHIHTFTMEHVPRGFLPLGLTGALRRVPFQKTTARVLRLLNPFDDQDRFSRYARFLEIGTRTTQAGIFEEVVGYYPDGTRFIILPMDMAFMGAGAPHADIDAQHAQLAELGKGNPETALPFMAIDPRRFHEKDALRRYLEHWFENEMHPDGAPVFRGVKLYPPLGYPPDDPGLADLWAFCDERSLPVLSHCSRGGVRARGLSADTLISFADPDRYRDLLRTYPNVPVCLAHFGGLQDWDLYFEKPDSRREISLDAPTEQRRHLSWLSKITQMIDSGKFPNLYTDISYTVFRIEKYLAPLTVILRGSERVRSRTLFGSDYYMTQQERFDERFLSMRLRAGLGEELFDQIARHNPARFLGAEQQALPATAPVAGVS